MKHVRRVCVRGDSRNSEESVTTSRKRSKIRETRE